MLRTAHSLARSLVCRWSLPFRSQSTLRSPNLLLPWHRRRSLAVQRTICVHLLALGRHPLLRVHHVKWPTAAQRLAERHALHADVVNVPGLGRASALDDGACVRLAARAQEEPCTVAGCGAPAHARAGGKGGSWWQRGRERGVEWGGAARGGKGGCDCGQGKEANSNRESAFSVRGGNLHVQHPSGEA